MSNNGYSIRANLLSLAVDILESRQRTRSQNEMTKPADERGPVETYSVVEVVEYAEALNRFVSSRH